MNQPEGVFIYRDKGTTPDDDSEMDKRKGTYEAEGSWDNYGLDIVMHN